MLIDNENKNYKVHEWIAKYTETGKLDIVTGYFTVGALAYLSKTTNEKIEHFRFVLGDIVNVDEVKDRELATWFETLWTKPQAHKNKTLKDEKGKVYTKPFKEYLIGEIERIFIEYTPEVILVCPKKLQNNWTRFKKHQNSKFEKDQFDYFVRFHTDLKMELMDKEQYRNERADTLFINDKPKLFVIDESHNLRNDKSNRFKFFVEEILRKNEDAKVLMLSATPINNSLNDIRNQFKLIVKGNSGGFYETLGIKNIDYAFRTAQRAFNEWRNEDNPKISEFIKDLPDNFFKLTDELTDFEKYQEWIHWISENEPKTYKQLQNPIDILIATDALSEGQNLQDADMVINYDIHWNPVRIIQRMGRIDRLGSPNSKIFGINFWPSNNINSYLDLQGRIEQRMAAMRLAGSEVHLDFSETFKEMAEDENLENRMKARMIEQMQTSWDDIEVNEQGLGFNNLSLEKYRQDLLEEYNSNTEKYSRMPKGVYTGFKAVQQTCSESGIIALLAYPSKPPKVQNHIYQTYDLIYINQKGKPVLLNQKEVLDALTLHKDEARFIPSAIDKGEEKAIQNLVDSIQTWLKNQAIEEEKQEDGTTRKKMGAEAKDLLSKIKSGDKDALKRINQNVKVSDKFQADNFDLITWFLVTV